ncbi:MAG: four helix bundle protein [Akkermansiaceae bacterium]|jgi:four helix bundle protein|nr:four helix bundle protein [Akkermansiaceae bacterium]MDP4647145.1 four helix bundle protein [Akkermansiaceae bacterium]MDP4722615.1 four helix bundle protein [Akkermansiaceae bacterium]MDP4780439.1 four helix bundle protein [Akkermansiaceae bacterium]MDP4847756.1 four helix bundle protein [Akkermansiaceae bacterium]
MDSQSPNTKPYDLEERTYAFALRIRLFLHNVKWEPVSWPDVKQLLRSSGSVAANHLESIEAISPTDSLYRLRIVKKEARESSLWLRLLNDCNPLNTENHTNLQALISESNELVKIFAPSSEKSPQTSLFPEV